MHQVQVTPNQRGPITGAADDDQPANSQDGSKQPQKIPWKPPHIPKAKFKPFDKCTRCGVYGHFERDCTEFWRISGSKTRVDPLSRELEEALSYETESESNSDYGVVCEKCGVSHGLWDCEYAYIRHQGPNAPRDRRNQQDLDELFIHHSCEDCFPRNTSRFLSVRGFRALGHLFFYLEKWRILPISGENLENVHLPTLLAQMGLSHLALLLKSQYLNHAAEAIRDHMSKELQAVARLLKWECPHEHGEGIKWMGYEERLAMKEELLLEVQKWELVRWVSARTISGGLKQAEKRLLMKLLERLECSQEGEMVGAMRAIAVPLPVVQGKWTQGKEEMNWESEGPGMSWDCFV